MTAEGAGRDIKTPLLWKLMPRGNPLDLIKPKYDLESFPTNLGLARC